MEERGDFAKETGNKIASLVENIDSLKEFMYFTGDEDIKTFAAMKDLLETGKFACEETVKQSKEGISVPPSGMLSEAASNSFATVFSYLATKFQKPQPKEEPEVLTKEQIQSTYFKLADSYKKAIQSKSTPLCESETKQLVSVCKFLGEMRARLNIIRCLRDYEFPDMKVRNKNYIQKVLEQETKLCRAIEWRMEKEIMERYRLSARTYMEPPSIEEELRKCGMLFHNSSRKLD